MWWRLKSRAWTCTSLASDSHCLDGFIRVPSIVWVVVITSSYSVLLLSASWTSRTVAAMNGRQAGHTWATGYIFLMVWISQCTLAPKVYKTQQIPVILGLGWECLWNLEANISKSVVPWSLSPSSAIQRQIEIGFWVSEAGHKAIQWQKPPMLAGEAWLTKATFIAD